MLFQSLYRTMAATRPRLQRPVHLVLDFDATLTVRDTIILLREIPLQRNRRLGKEVFAVPEWSSLEQAYMQDYERHKKTEAALDEDQEKHPGSFPDQAKSYSGMLARRRALEERSMERLVDWDFFRGVTRADVASAAEAVVADGRLEMRDGWSRMLEMFLPSGRVQQHDASKVSIISLNWSRAFIRQSMLSALRVEKPDSPDLARFIREDLTIHASEIAGLDDPDGSSGEMQADVLSNTDKLRCLPPAAQRLDILQTGRKSGSEAPYLVYVGDSSTDFDCLTAADTGIWLCPAGDIEEAERKCRQVFKPLELKVRPISRSGNEGDGQVDELIWAQNFEQITQYLSTLAPP